MACVPEAEPGDYVVVHAGLAICLINEAEAKQTLIDLEMIGASQEETVIPE
jgi:hydrogenase expression/formation protein HypC